MSTRALSYEQTLDIMCGPRDIPPHITAQVETQLNEDRPLVDIDRFSEFVTGLMVRPAEDAETAMRANFASVVALGSCSIEMAWQQAGDIHIPRPRRKHEHDQSVLNTFDRVFAARFTDPRDTLLKPMFSLQDGGKAHTVALATLANPEDRRKSRLQSIHNHRFARNLLGHLPDTVMPRAAKQVAMLLIRQTAIGSALGRHADKGQPLDTVVAQAQTQLDELRAQCPPDYRDRFDDYLLVSYLTDAGAHTQRARYIDADTGKVRTDVLPEHRYNSDGSETMMTLDRLFSEAPADMDDLKLYQPKHLAVMRQLFPNHYA